MGSIGTTVAHLLAAGEDNTTSWVSKKNSGFTSILGFRILFKVGSTTETEGCSLLPVVNQELRFSIANAVSKDFNSLFNWTTW